MSRPVIYVPGLPGSHLLDRDSGRKIFLNIPALLSPTRRKEVLHRLRGPDNLQTADSVIAGEPIRRTARLLLFDIAKQADSLYDILERVGIEVKRFGWDWRRPVWDGPMLTKLHDQIVQMNQDSGLPVTLIAHSTGGLVVRRLLEEKGQDVAFLDRIERVIGFGVPWAGTLKSLEFLAGEIGFGAGLVSPAQAQDTLARSWASFDLLPPDPSTTDLRNVDGSPLDLAINTQGQQVSPLIARDWYPANLRAAMEARAIAADRELGNRSAELATPARSIPVTNVVGWGTETTLRARILGSGTHQRIRFVRGKGDDTDGGGDGTVPRVSAAWLRGAAVNTYHVPVGMDSAARRSPHSTLWRNPGGRNLLRHLLGGKAMQPFLYGAIDDEDFQGRPNVRLRLVALGPDGQPLTGARVRATNLVGGPEINEAFQVNREGRHLLSIPRNRIPRLSDSGQLRRLRVEISGERQGERHRRRESYFLRG